MSEFNFASADYARSTSGTKTLQSNIQGDLDNAIRAVKGKGLNNIKSAVKAAWSGEDADQFIANIEMNASEIAELLKKLKSKVQQTLDTDAKYFAQMQANNRSTVESAKKSIGA